MNPWHKILHRMFLLKSIKRLVIIAEMPNFQPGFIELPKTLVITT